MSFDRIDRQFRPPKPIVLECTQCASTEGVTMLFPLTRRDPRQPAEREALCPACSGRKPLENVATSW